MKNYNTYTDANSPLESKTDRPVSSLLTGSLKVSPSASAALLVGILEIVVGAILLFPGVLGIIYVHWGLVTYGCYGILLIVFGVIGFIGIRRRVGVLVNIFFVWKIVSVLIVVGITVAVILLVVFNVIPQLSNWWFTIVIIGGLGLVFEFWSIGGILWVRPLWLEYKEPLVIDDPIPLDTPEHEPYVPPPPQLGVAPTEDPMRAAVRIFNKNPDQGIRYLIDRGLIDGSFKDIAKFLHTADDLNSSKLGDFLGENKPFNIGVLQAFADYFDFSNMEFDNGLREFLLLFRLPGEAQKIDRIMECFAQRFAANNPGMFPDSDTAYLLAFSLIMLNTDAHNPAIKQKMSKKAFVANNTGIRGKDDIPVSFLEHLYDRIVSNEIKMESDGLFTRAAFKGWLEKRSTHNKWQKRWFVLKNNCLYYFNKPEEENPRVCIPLEGLLVRKIETPTTSTSQGSLSSMFEIVDPYLQAVKCVKFTANGPEEGQHQRFLFMAATREEADEWVNTLQNNNLGNPVLQLLKKRKNVIVSKHTSRVPQQATLPPIMMDDVEVSIGTNSAPPEDNYSMNNNGSSSGSSSGGGGGSSSNTADTADTHNANDSKEVERDNNKSNIENTVINISSSSGIKKPPPQEVNWNHEMPSP